MQMCDHPPFLNAQSNPFTLTRDYDTLQLQKALPIDG